MKPFSWSFSKLKSYETCPKRYYEVDISKRFADDGEAMKWGNKVHDAFKEALKNGKPLPPDLLPYQHWIDETRAGPGELLVEQKYAITREFAPTEYFSPVVWYRGIADALKIDGPVAMVRDWKTGGIKVDDTQLMLMALCVFAFHPAVHRIKAEFVWLQEDCTTPQWFNRRDLATNWLGLIERVKVLEGAHQTMDFPPKPCGLCFKYCPVQSCPFWKKGSH